MKLELDVDEIKYREISEEINNLIITCNKLNNEIKEKEDELWKLFNQRQELNNEYSSKKREINKKLNKAKVDHGIQDLIFITGALSLGALGNYIGAPYGDIPGAIGLFTGAVTSAFISSTIIIGVEDKRKNKLNNASEYQILIEESIELKNKLDELQYKMDNLSTILKEKNTLLDEHNEQINNKRQELDKLIEGYDNVIRNILEPKEKNIETENFTSNNTLTEGKKRVLSKNNN